MEQPLPKKFHTRIEIRIIAGIVAVALIISLVANAAVVVRIKADDETDAAMNYLVDKTGYVNAGTVDRIQEKLKTLSAPEALEDYYRLAGTQIAEEDYAGALQSIEQCIALDDGSNRELHLDLLMKQACLLIMLDRGAEALAPLDLVLQLKPDYADALLIKAQVYEEQQDIPNLVKTLDQYLEYESDNTELRVLLAQAMFSIEDYDGAMKQYRKILDSGETDLDMTEIQYLYGLTCIQTGAFTEAEESLLKALETDDALDGIYYYIGVCQMSREAFDEAVEFFSKAIEKNSMLQLSHYCRGVSGLMVEGYDMAVIIADLKLAAEYTGSDADMSVRTQAAELLRQLTEPSESP